MSYEEVILYPLPEIRPTPYFPLLFILVVAVAFMITN